MLQLFKIEVSRLFSEIKTYLLDNLVGIADDVLICTGILVGVGSDFFPGRSQEYALIGMILWRVTIVSLQTSCGIVQKELRLGTLEQLMLSNYSFLKLLIVRLEAKMLVESCKLFFSTIVIMLMFNIKIYSKINFGLFILVLLVSCIGTFGMGFVVAGIALVYKKAVALVNSISYFILFFTGTLIPLEMHPKVFSPIAKALPFIWAVNTIQENQLGRSFLLLMILSITWVAFGVGFFKFCNSKILLTGAAGKY